MIYDPDTDPHLKSWLVKNLEPICDAEPGALADYILALLKHPALEPDLRNELVSQLEEFLEKGSETTNFIDLLFNALRSKSYLPYTSSPPPPPSHPPRIQSHEEPSSISDAGIPIPLDVLGPHQHPSSRKRSLEHANDEREYRKGPRLSNDLQFSRYGNSGRQWPGPNRGGRGRDPGNYGGEVGVTQGVNGANSMGQYVNGRPQQQYRPPDQVKKGICRDYHNHGYCSRGAYCKYSHGEDAVVPSQLLPIANMPNGMVPFMSMINNAMFPVGGMANNGVMAGGGGAYDPHERMDMRPRGGMTRTPMMHRQDGPTPSSGELPVIQDLTPRIPMEEHHHNQSQSGYVPMGRSGDGIQGYANAIGMDIDTDGMQQPQQQHNHYQQPPSNHHHKQPNGGHRGGGRRGGRAPHVPGMFPMDDVPQPDLPSTSPNPFPFPTSVPRPERRNDKTLVVEKIPEDHLSLGAVNDWFKRFGTITNVAVDAQSAKALVSFAEHEDAHKAWKSEDAIFGNRFVKVFWHRPMGGHGGMGARMLQASAPLVSKLATQDSTTGSNSGAAIQKTTAPAAESSIGVSTSLTSAKKLTSSTTVSALAAKQELLKQQIVEQKSLMAKLELASSLDEKKEILGRLRKLGEEMKNSTTTGPPATITSLTSAKRTVSTPGTGRSEDQERMERERLDKELELHAATTAVDSEAEESTEDLKAKLAKLKAEAASLGLPEADPSYPAYSSGSYYRPYRGRARGTVRGGYYRGRGGGGGPPRTSMKLDNRPKKLLLKGAHIEGIQTVKDWYATTGLLESVEAIEGGDLVVSFKTRAAAEQGLAKGSNVPTVGQVQVSWYTDQPTIPPQQSHQPSISSHTDKQEVSGGPGKADHTPAPGHDTHGIQEEELVASGWGDDGEDGMGML